MQADQPHQRVGRDRANPLEASPEASGADGDSGRALAPEQLAALQEFREGDAEAAFQTLVRPHLDSLIALARRLTGDPHWAEDLVQETLVRAFTGLTGFRGEGTLRSWLFRILARLAAEPRRWKRQDRAHALGDLDVPDHLDIAPDRSALDRELRERIDEAMERLTQKQRLALHLRAVEGLDYAAIAAVLENTEGASRMLVLAARRKVLDRVQEYLEP